MKINKTSCFIFPGQGSQYSNMLSQFYTDSIFSKTFKFAEEVLGFNILEMIKDPDPYELNLTENTQPALLVTSVALFRMWQQYKGILPSVVVGHSLGEYSALVCANAINFADAINIVKYRGKIMQQAVPTGIGAMAAILGLKNEEVISLCEQATQEMMKENKIVEAANFNSPGQVVVSGHKEAVNKLIEIAKNKGVRRAILLPVSVPSHSSLMQEASYKLEKSLEKIVVNTPEITIVQNVTALHSNDKDKIKDNLIKQLYSPVKWSESIINISNGGVSDYIESGPSNVLCGLNKRILNSSNSFTLDDKSNIWNNT
jgi:[acyl-carrier-protein] S-malonyltransferase